MDLGTTITALLIAAACVIPFVIMNKLNARRERKILEPLFNLAQKHDSTISGYDIWNNAAVGIDNRTEMVFFFKKATGTDIFRQVNLSEIRKCRLIQVTKTSGDEQDNFKPVAKLELVLEHQDSSKADIMLEFYNADLDGGTLTGELQLVEKWRQLIDKKIASK